ncbi:hypothetical protein [Larkinella soli]|uniref:hypothetical protein n=1 Tax=Larkinella soli TaxID=1770527 RepID=UPI000FFB8E5F|nr:hypothetical protein [Larkinella soli]
MEKPAITKEELLGMIERARVVEEHAQEQIRHWKKEEIAGKTERLQREAELAALKAPDALD